ncbi:MAG TPA: signal peptidase II [Clostridiales bacterium]|nr:MAG: signal peptidase II [Clostridiales bacterium GWD2_32_19]HCC07694.1 signal peptidase II [Clostridiales bacterium]
MRYFIIIALIFLDQFTKYLVVNGLKYKDSIDIVPSILRLDYVENTGAAFGIMKDAQMIFIIITITFLIMAVIYYEKEIKQQKNRMYNIIYILILAGAIGNLIDRVVNKYVVDFISFYVINYPVFNIADSFICIGCVLLGVMVIMNPESRATQRGERHERV